MNIEQYLELKQNRMPKQLLERINAQRDNLVVYEQRTYHLIDDTTGELIDDYIDSFKPTNDEVAPMNPLTPVTILWDGSGWYAPFNVDGATIYESSNEEFEPQIDGHASREMAIGWAEQMGHGAPIFIWTCPITITFAQLQQYSHQH